MFANFKCAFAINNFHLMKIMNANSNSNEEKKVIVFRVNCDPIFI